jgi:hypothetical protein
MMSPIEYGILNDKALLETVELRQKLAAERDSLDKQVKELSDQIGTEMALRGVPRLEVGPWTTLLIDGKRESLSKPKLLQAGVTVAQLEAATESTPYTMVRVNRRKEKENGKETTKGTGKGTGKGAVAS